MSFTDSPNGTLVSRRGLEISNEIVRIMRAYTGRGPTKARTHFSHNLVTVVMQDTMTKGERSLSENGKGALVLEMRRCFQETMRDDMVVAVEEHTGCKVVACMSDNHLDPDMAIESFILETRKSLTPAVTCDIAQPRWRCRPRTEPGGSMSETYVHGYDPRENARLQDQAGTLVDLLHADTAYPRGSTVLEAGCGVGAQTVTLAQRSPEARFTSVDISSESIAQARRRTDRAGLTNVEFRQGDIFHLPFDAESFDHVFVCFVLEHLSRPVEALVALDRVLRPGGSMTVIEGDHGSAYFHPDSPAAHAAIQCQIELQAEAGGDALIGRQLYPLMVEARLDAVLVSPRMVYVDSSRPDLVDGFTRKTFTAMIEGVRESAIAAGLIEPPNFDAGVQDLHRTTEADGVFCYTFFKGVGKKRRA